MSRIVVFGLDNIPVGEFAAKCNRGWTLLGNPGVSDGGQTTVEVPDDVAVQPWLQMGRMVLIERPGLPAWAGVIDTPWTALLPVEITLYNVEYLLSLRAAEVAVRFTNTMYGIIKEAIRIANIQEETFIREGNASGDVVTQFTVSIEQRKLWDQIMDFLQNSGYEMIWRPTKTPLNQLYLYADIGTALGYATDFLLHDGENGNIKVINATVNGRIINRVKGVSGQSTTEDQLETEVLESQSSQDAYRTRSDVVQFKDITGPSMLTQYTQTYLDLNGRPYLDLEIEAQDVGNTFANLRVGNTGIVHASKVYLPGGIRGWRGTVRILAMAYNEDKNTVRMTVRGAL